MYCDYDKLIEYSILLNNLFNQITNVIGIIEDANKTIYASRNWNSETRDYYFKAYDVMLKNYDILLNKFRNVTEYLDVLINNYKTFESQVSASFGG